MFKNAYEEIIKPSKIKLDFINSVYGITYLVKDYPVRIFNREPFRYIACGCRGGIFRESTLCKHIISTLVLEFLRQNPNLVLLDANKPIKTALEEYDKTK